MCTYIPIQRIAAVCAHSTLSNITIAGLQETVFVTCPIPFKYHA